MINNLWQRLTNRTCSDSKEPRRLSSTRLELKDGDYVVAPACLEEMDVYERDVELAAVANRTLNQVEQLQKQIRAADQGDADLNPFPNKIALKNAEMLGGNVDATLEVYEGRSDLKASLQLGSEYPSTITETHYTTGGKTSLRKLEFRLDKHDYLFGIDRDPKRASFEVYQT